MHARSASLLFSIDRLWMLPFRVNGLADMFIPFFLSSLSYARCAGSVMAACDSGSSVLIDCGG